MAASPLAVDLQRTGTMTGGERPRVCLPTGTSVPIPQWSPVSEEDKRLHAHARELLEIRGRAPGNRLPNHLLPPGGVQQFRP